MKLQNCHGNRSDAAKMASRFEDVTDSDVAALKDAAENMNTRKSTVNWLRVFENWWDENAHDKSAEKLPPEQLDKVLKLSGLFYASVREQDGTDYEPGSLKVMQAALDRHLKEKGYSLSVIKDREFLSSRKVLEGKARKLRNEGKGKLPNKSNKRGRRSAVGMRTAWKFISKVPPLHNVVAPVTASWFTWLPRTLHNECGGFHA